MIENRYAHGLFLFAYFLICYATALYWYESGYFSVSDIFFDSDPDTNLASFAHGVGRNSLTHALQELIFYPIKGIEVIYQLAVDIQDVARLREIVALTISPLFSTLTLICFFYILRELQLDTKSAVWFTVLFAVSLNNIVFAIIPESYAVSGFLIAALIYYQLRLANLGQGGHPLVWGVLAVCLAGVTVTNIAIFCLVYFVHLFRIQGFNYFKAALIAGGYSLGALIIMVALYKVSHWGDTATDVRSDWINGAGNVATFVISSLWQVKSNLINLFAASVNALVGFNPNVFLNQCSPETVCNAVSVTRRTDSDLIWLGVVAALSIAMIGLSVKPLTDQRWHNLYFVSIPIIAFNFLLHSLFGQEMFLYIQHWILPLLLLLVPILVKRLWMVPTLSALFIAVNLYFLFSVDAIVTAGWQQ